MARRDEYERRDISREANADEGDRVVERQVEAEGPAHGQHVHVTQEVRDPPAGREVLVEREATHVPWSLAPIIAMVIGIGLVVIGSVAMARGGFSDVLNHTTVAGLHHTPLLGFLELVFGLLTIASAAASVGGLFPWSGRGMMTFLGGIMLAFGLIVVIEPSSFHSTLGMHATNGWLYTFVGAIMIVAAILFPAISGSDRVKYRG